MIYIVTIIESSLSTLYMLKELFLQSIQNAMACYSSGMKHCEMCTLLKYYSMWGAYLNISQFKLNYNKLSIYLITRFIFISNIMQVSCVLNI